MHFGLRRRKGQKQADVEVARKVRRQASDQLSVTSIARRPQAIVVILGYTGAETDELATYSKLWHNLNCSTVLATAPILASVTNDVPTIGEVSITACREAARLIRLGELSEMGFGKISVIIHVLSHGGCQLLEETEHRIREIVTEQDVESSLGASTPQASILPLRKTTSTRSLALSSVSTDDSDGSDHEHDDDKPRNLLVSATHVHAVAERPRLALGHRLANTDGAPRLARRRRRPRRMESPRVNRVDVERNAFSFSSIPTYNAEDRAYQRDLSLFASRLALGSIIFDSAPCYPSIQSELGDPPTVSSGTKVVKGRPEQFWRNMQELSLCKRHAFIYGLADEVCDPKELKEFIKEKQRIGISVITAEMGDTGHLEHLQQYRGRYSEFLDQALKGLNVRRIGEDLELDEWSSDEEEDDEDEEEDEQPKIVATPSEEQRVLEKERELSTVMMTMLLAI